MIAAAARRHVTPWWGCGRGTAFRYRNPCGCSDFRRTGFRKFPVGNLRLPESNLRTRFDLAQVPGSVRQLQIEVSVDRAGAC
jgi:hypothetical protein